MSNPIVLRSVGAILDTASGIDQTLALPAGVQAGDYLVAVVIMASSGATSPAPSNTLTWTTDNNDGTFMKVFGTYYDGSAAAPTLHVAGNALVAVMLAFENFESSSPLEAIQASPSFVSQVNARFPALTVGAANTAVLSICKTNGAVTGYTQSSGWTKVVDHNCSASSMGLCVQLQLQTTATNIAQTDVTVTGGSSVSQTGLTMAYNSATAAPTDPDTDSEMPAGLHGGLDRGL